MGSVKIGTRSIGDGQPCFIIAEIGINHNGDLDVARKLISAALLSGCDAVKFQKRTVSVVYTAEELAKPRENPFGPTNGDLKRGLEFGEDEYRAITEYCKLHSVLWFASCWDEGSVDFIDSVQPALLQDRLGLSHRRRSAAAPREIRQADHPLDRHEHPR